MFGTSFGDWLKVCFVFLEKDIMLIVSSGSHGNIEVNFTPRSVLMVDSHIELVRLYSSESRS
jgi:hypothetical protein